MVEATHEKISSLLSSSQIGSKEPRPSGVKQAVRAALRGAGCSSARGRDQEEQL